MGNKWKRDVTWNGTWLVVSTPAGGNPSGRNDTDTDITVKSADKPAEVEYSPGASSGVSSLNVTWKDAEGNTITSPPSGFGKDPKNNKVTVNDNDPSNTESCYYHVTGTVNGVTQQTQDPQIHNSP